MRIAFFGTPPFAAELLSAVHAAGHEVARVYTQPPKPRGRGQGVRPTAVQEVAEGLGLPLSTPLSMKAPDEVRAFLDLGLDAAVVVAYGQILIKDVLEAPRLGCFNVHASLLPRWRGAAPIQRAIMAGDTQTGVQIMRMSVGLDEGPVLSRATIDISDEETAGTLQSALLAAAMELLPSTLALIERGLATEQPQDEAGATYARKIATGERRIDWSKSAADVDRIIRGLSPSPGAWFELPTSKGPVRVKALLSRCREGSRGSWANSRWSSSCRLRDRRGAPASASTGWGKTSGCG